MPALFNLPNEILLQILLLIPTAPLLKAIPVCHRFQNLVLRIIHSRLLVAASLKDRRLILECYHPSAQYTEPYLFCDYLGTPGLSDQKEGQGWLYEVYEGDGRLGRLRGLYSRFRPTRPDADPPFRSHPAGDIPGSRTYPEVLSDRAAEPIQLVTQTLNLDSHELFSQLCVSVNLVQVGPRRGVFLSCIDVLRKAIPRVWREWLAEGAESLDGPSIETMDLEDEKQSRRVIWADSGKNVGLRARVRERKWGRNAPILMRKDDDEAISYTLEFEELLVRTTHVLLAVEKSLLETSANSTKAMVFGSFVSSSTP